MNHHDGSSVAAQAYEHIRSRLFQGEFPAGMQLVTRQIAQELGASLNPVREAIGRLAAEGLVDHVPGAGAFVHSPTPQEIVELYEFREAIEPAAAAKAARTITDLELSVLQSICDDQHAMVRSLREPPGHLESESLQVWLATEERFHETLIRAARNMYFDRTVNNSRFLTRLFHSHLSLRVHVDLQVAARTWLSHVRILRALERGDGDSAATIMRHSLRRGLATVLGANELPPRPRG